MKSKFSGTLSKATLLIVASIASGYSAQDHPAPEDGHSSIATCFSSLAAYNRVLVAAGDQLSDESRVASNGSAACGSWHLSALELARELLRANSSEEAREILSAMKIDDESLDTERMFLLYAIAKFDLDEPEMIRVSSELLASGKKGPYVSAVRGIELCLQDKCSEAVRDLEFATARTGNSLAQSYLVAAYAYSGNWQAAESGADKIALQIGDADELGLYVSVLAYLKAGRTDDARRLASVYFEQNSLIEDSAMIQEVRRLLEESQ